MNDSHSQLLYARARREEMMQTAEKERLLQSIRPSIWQRVRRFIVLPKRHITLTSLPSCEPTVVKVQR